MNEPTPTDPRTPTGEPEVSGRETDAPVARPDVSSPNVPSEQSNPVTATAGGPRRADSRRFADQYDILSDDPGEHRVDASDEADRARPSVDWATEVSVGRISSELRRIEAEVRQILDAHDLKRKRRMAGTRRWNELEEDIIAWRYSDRIDDALLIRLRDLVTRRHHVFQRLRFIASTRPTWNS